MGLCLTLRNFTGEKAIALLIYSANLKDMFDNPGVCEGEAVLVLAFLLRDSAKDVSEVFTANEMRNDDYVYHGSRPVVINAIVKRSDRRSAPKST